MRVWDLPPGILCRQHLLGEHREIHCIFNVILRGRKGYCNHPEIKRWVGKLGALKNRHDLVVQEMKKRGYGHYSNIDLTEEKTGIFLQTKFVNTIPEQISILRSKGCACKLPKETP